ncbi:MAG: hypothetical protein HY820_43910 [Acidobacteria bacterium]|nr:hypothetical protein [Acidobacteriota bacterium]
MATQNNGKITAMKNWMNGEEVNYSYDALGRLSAMSVAMDANNRIVGHSYDAAGNTTVANGITMTWDGMGRMSSAAGESYVCNPGSTRILKGTIQAGLLYVRGLDGSVREVRNVSGGVIGSVQQGPTVRFAGREVGVKGDRLGTVQNGSRYFPYGEESPSTGNNTDKFATYHRDAGTGFDYAMNRYYMPAVGGSSALIRIRQVPHQVVAGVGTGIPTSRGIRRI